MNSATPEKLFGEFLSKLIDAGLPERQARAFAEECFGYRDLDRACFELPIKQELPSDDCFRTLAEALRILEAKTRVYHGIRELYAIDKYLKVPYSDVIAAKRAIAENFGVSEAAVEEVYAKNQEWLLFSAESVNEFAAFLRAHFRDPELMWAAYQTGAYLGLKDTKRRIDRVLELLGEEIGWQVIRNDVKNGGLLYYSWYSDPVGCIAYMVEYGLSPEQIRRVLEKSPLLLYMFKEYRKRSYGHDQEYIDRTIQRHIQEN